VLLPQHPQGRRLAPDQRFKGLNAHGTSLILVPDVLQSPNLIYRTILIQQQQTEIRK
jgi:hypothetical protein